MHDRRRLPRALAMLTVLGTLVVAAAGVALALMPHAKHMPAAQRYLGPVRGAERIRFTMVLRLPQAARARATVEAIEDPRSRMFRHFLSPHVFGARFGLSNARLGALERSLASHGLHVTARFPQRTELVVSGAAADVERLLRVRIGMYVDSAGRRFHAPIGTPTVPTGLADAVTNVTGLDTRARWHPNDVPIGGLVPATSTKAYDVAPLRAAGVDGHGQTIAVISFSAFDPSDQDTWMRLNGVTGPAPQVVPVDGGTTNVDGADETNLDIDVIRNIAPQAQIVVYEVSQSSSSYADAISRIVADHQTGIISSSWGICELGVSTAEQEAERRALSTAVASGVSMFVASGDAGAYDCQQNDLSYHRLSVDWPAAASNAVAVGGTRLDTAADGSYRGETAWEGQLSGAGGGGGFTRGDRRPSWQNGPGVLSSFSNGRRQLPDVSADADPSTGWAIYTSGQSGEAGGTSAAAPFWASSMLLIEQYASSQGVHRIGYINPLLYTLARSTQPFPPFHDVTAGANRYYQAGPGWDPSTGLGSPDVFNLARDLTAYLRAHPAR